MLYKKVCVTCGTDYEAAGPAGRYCSNCTPKCLTKEYGRERNNRARLKAGKFVGIGSGNHPNNRGEKHPFYVDGWTSYQKIRNILKNERGSCERCGKDLSTATRWQWVCHHKDHNKHNSSIDNLEILCKSCHQIEHKCWKAFEGATTIPNGSTSK